MAGKVNPIPEGYGTVTPYLCVKGAAEAIELWKKALGAEELFRMPGPGDRVMHAEVKIGTSIVMLSDEFPDFGQLGPTSRGGSTCTMMMYVPDCDAAWKRAVDAGCTSTSEPKDEFWGDRFAKVTDPFGHQWAFATHVEDVSPEEMQKRAAAMFEKGC